jgi:hypothetical protein
MFFQFFLKGVLDCLSTDINEEMEMAVAYASVY